MALVSVRLVGGTAVAGGAGLAEELEALDALGGAVVAGILGVETKPGEEEPAEVGSEMKAKDGVEGRILENPL